MASDGQGNDAPDFKGFSLSLTTADVDEAQRKFTALGEGGQVVMPLGRTFFAPGFGMLVDRFGVSWMVLAMA
jgi:PhnB protein